LMAQKIFQIFWILVSKIILTQTLFNDSIYIFNLL
jgi:hypothetical protein